MGEEEITQAPCSFGLTGEWSRKWRDVAATIVAQTKNTTNAPARADVPTTRKVILPDRRVRNSEAKSLLGCKRIGIRPPKLAGTGDGLERLWLSHRSPFHLHQFSIGSYLRNGRGKPRFAIVEQPDCRSPACEAIVKSR